MSGATSARASLIPAWRSSQPLPYRPHTFHVATLTVDSTSGPYGA
jgi:hypothetical protein